MSEDNKCFFCDSECETHSIPDRVMVTYFKCKYCGKYIIEDSDIWQVPGEDKQENKFKIACILNERRLKGLDGVVVCDNTDNEKDIHNFPLISALDLLDKFPKKAGDFLNRVLLNLSRLPKMPFDVIKTQPLSLAGRLNLFALKVQTFRAIIKELNERKLIDKSPANMQSYEFNLTAKFWEVVEKLQQTEIDSKRVFVAMWFNKSMDECYANGIKPAIEEAGYTPIRIDGQDFNGKICDEIIAEINRSKFVIADFCGQRGGVYFEAGYAMGQGKPVIFTASEVELEKAHFDTRQYNHIGYDSPEDLRKKLYNRICATII